jgi:hypothetical protein
MHYAVANVPFGGVAVEQNLATDRFTIHNPGGSDDDPNWLAPRMLEFYGNWTALEKSVSSSPDLLVRERAKETQNVFLHILRAFAPGLRGMQHPNITLEITVEK